jgi:hypothetical protein
VCQGEIARINRHNQAAADPPSSDPADGPERIFLMPGFVEDRPGEWRASARRVRMEGRGQHVTVQTDMQMGQRKAAEMRTPKSTGAFMPMRLPFRLQCPHCGTVAEVSASLLD